MYIVYCFNPGEPNISERIILALKLSSTVHGTSTHDRRRREAPAAAQESDVGADHEMYRKSSQFCEHQEVCENYTSPYIHTPPGKLYVNVIRIYMHT